MGVALSTMTDNASNNLPEIILTRPKEVARKFHALIQETLPEAKVIISPLITIDFLPKSIDFTKFDTFIFTSINGVQAIENQRIPHGTLCFAVGAKTAHAAGKIGFKAESHSASATKFSPEALRIEIQ